MRRCRKHTQAVVRYGMPPKTPLEPAGRHVAEAKAAIDRQREMIRAINAAEQSTELAETVLATMEWTLANFDGHHFRSTIKVKIFLRALCKFLI